MARQRISHGSEINTATPEEVAAIVATAMDRKQVTEYRRLKGIINLDASGNGQSRPAENKIPSQFDILLERVTIGGAGAVSALVVVYENQVQDSDLLEVIQLGTVGKYSDSFSNRIYVTANSAIILAVTGGVPNLQVTYNLQGRLIPAS